MLDEAMRLDWQALQTLVAEASVTAGFLYQMGVTFEWKEMQLIASIPADGNPTSDRQPGKIILMRGLRRLVDVLITQALLRSSAASHDGFPPNITAFLQRWDPPNQL